MRYAKSDRTGWAACRGRLRSLAVSLAVLLAPLVAIQPAAAQETGTIVGVVATQDGEPLVSAQVSLVGTQRGTFTDQQGRFLLPGVPAGERQVRVMLLGYRAVTETVQLTAGETANVEIVLAVSAIALDEVVVTGTAGGSQRRALGNVVSAIRAAEVTEIAPIRDIQSLINARAPGVVITPGTGQVGAGSQIRIRGSSSVSLANTPLLYVDGVRVDNVQNSGPAAQGFSSSPISRINDFNPDDIESIEIIKGPAAATLYGTEAANGVIQIITRQGREGTASWNLTVRQGANWFNNAEGRVPTNYWRSPPDPNVPGDEGTVHSINFARTERERGTPIWRTGHLQNYNLSVSGGTADVRYHLSGNMDREEGADWDNALRRAGGRANITVMASPTLQIGGNLGYTRARFQLAGEAGTGGSTWAAYFSTPFHFETNDPNRTPGPDGVNDRRRGARSFTPEFYHDTDIRTQDLGRFTGSLNVTHTPAEWLTHRLTFGVDDTREDNQTLTEITPIYLEWSQTGGGSKSVGRREVTSTTLDYGATISASLGRVLAGLAGGTSRTSFGFQYYNQMLRTMSTNGSEFPLAGLRVINATNPDTRSGFENFVETVSLGIYGQQEFGWQDRLFLTLGLRADDHSAFGEDFSLVYYPKVSAAWVITEEPFWRVPFVNDLRLRTAFGAAGQQPGAFDALQTYSTVAGPGGEVTVTPRNPGNQELGPERGQEFEIGFDAGFMNDRAGLEFAYYNQRTRDAIVLQPQAPSTGFPEARFINVGELRNFGFEATLRAQPVVTRNVTWDATFSLARNDSEVVDLGDQEQIGVGFGVTHKLGYPIAGWHHRRVVDTEFDDQGAVKQETMLCDDGNGGTTPCFNAAGVIVAPAVFLGRSEPLHEGAFSSTITLFQRFRLYGLVDFKTGFKKWDHVLRVRCSLNNICFENVSPKSFVGPNVESTAETRAKLASYQNADNFGDEYINDSSFLRFREVSLSYLVPPHIVERMGASRATLTLSARNLGTITNWTGMDPEARFLGGARGLFGGLEQNHLPQTTSFLTSVNITF